MNSSVCKNILEETDGVFNSMVSEPYYWILEKVNIFAATILSQAVLLSKRAVVQYTVKQDNVPCRPWCYI